MSSKRQINDDSVFLLRGEDGEIYVIEDPDTIADLEATVKALEDKDDDEIVKQLLRIVNPKKYGKRL